MIAVEINVWRSNPINAVNSKKPSNQLMIKSQMADWYGTWLHEALFLDPVMRDIEKLMENSQQNVTGKVFITLLPYRFELNGIESKYDFEKEIVMRKFCVMVYNIKKPEKSCRMN